MPNLGCPMLLVWPISPPTTIGTPQYLWYHSNTEIHLQVIHGVIPTFQWHLTHWGQTTFSLWLRTHHSHTLKLIFASDIFTYAILDLFKTYSLCGQKCFPELHLGWVKWVSSAPLFNPTNKSAFHEPPPHTHTHTTPQPPTSVTRGLRLALRKEINQTCFLPLGLILKQMNCPIFVFLSPLIHLCAERF